MDSKKRSSKISIVAVGLCAVAVAAAYAKDAMKVPDSAKDAAIIKVGNKVPKVDLVGLDNKKMSLNKILAGKPTAIIFYRGGWCPFCNKQLMDVAKNEEKLKELGYQIIAITPDTPAEIKKTLEKDELGYRIFSDSKADAMKKFGVAFRLDDGTFNLYKDKYGLNLEERSGQNHHILPVPTVLLIDKKGVVKYVYSNPDYTVRLKGSELIEAAKTGM